MNPSWSDRPMAKHHAGAYRNGWRRAEQGASRGSCPYNRMDTARVGKGRTVPTGARAYAKAWLKGFVDWNESKKP